MGLFEYINLNNRVGSYQSLNKFRNIPQVEDPRWSSINGSIPPWVNGVLYRIGNKIIKEVNSIISEINS